MSTENQHVDLPEEAVEALAVWHYNLTHDLGEKHGTPWVKASEAEKAKSLDQARYRLQHIIAPFIVAKAVEEKTSEPVEGGCQRPDACEWNWWPDHCSCPTNLGKRVDAPEPPEMVERNRVSAANETNARIKRDQERVERCAEYLRKAEDRAEKAEHERDSVVESYERMKRGRTEALRERDQAIEQERERLRERAVVLQRWARVKRREAKEVSGPTERLKLEWVAKGYDGAADLILAALDQDPDSNTPSTEGK